ncbi:MAG: hypothetical protein NT157_01495 [Candidatus Micrarchaeota archaeon]|nr:hypothetical protein [Candidatus Micrarchaeota archaeon]
MKCKKCGHEVVRFDGKCAHVAYDEIGRAYRVVECPECDCKTPQPTGKK